MPGLKRITDLPEAGTIVGDELLEVSQVSSTVMITATTISATAADNSFNDSAAGFLAAGFAVGDRVRVSGFTGNVANNILAGTITALTTAKMTIGGADGNVIVDDAAGESVAIAKWTSRRLALDDLPSTGGTNLTYTAATRVIASDTGTDATLPLVTSGDAGLAPASGGGTANFLRADGTWAAPSAAVTESIIIAVGDETTAITTGTAKVTFRMPYPFNLSAVRASLTAASSSGNPTVDINEGGTSILSTKLSIDSGEKTSTTATTAAVISDSSLADDAEITIDIDTAGTGAAGLKVILIGSQP